MGPGVRIDPSRTRRGEIMLGAGAAASEDGEGDEQASERAPTEEEAAPAAGSAEFIVDITTTGATLAANGLKVIEDGVILRSQANLVAARAAPWDAAQRETARLLLDRVAAQKRARSYREVRTRFAGLNETLLDATREKFGVAAPFGGPTSSGMLTLHCPPENVHALASFLREQGAEAALRAAIGEEAGHWIDQAHLDRFRLRSQQGRDAERRGRGRARAHRDAGRHRRARASDRRRLARHARGGPRASSQPERPVTTPPRLQLADELLRRFAATLRSAQLYSKGHPIIARNLESLATALQLLHSLQPSVVVGLVADEVIVDDMPMAKADTMGPLVRRLQTAGVERITIDRGVTMDELVSPRRSQAVAYPRQVAMYLSRELTDASLPMIGKEFGGRDHTTVIHAKDKIGRLIREDRSVYNLVQELTARIKQAR